MVDYKSYLKKIGNKVNNFVKEYGLFLNLFLSILAISMSSYVLFQGQNSGAYVDTAGNPIKSPGKLLAELPKDLYFLGNPKAKVTVVEFADFQCPFCERYFTDVFPNIKRDYIDTGKIKFVHADLAFLGEESIQAARASRCAGEQGKFWEYHDILYKKQGGENSGIFNDTNLVRFADSLGLNNPAFSGCLSSDKYIKDIEDIRNLEKQYSITSTPSTLINGKLVKGVVPYQNIVQIIDSELK